MRSERSTVDISSGERLSYEEDTWIGGASLGLYEPFSLYGYGDYEQREFNNGEVVLLIKYDVDAKRIEFLQCIRPSIGGQWGRDTLVFTNLTNVSPSSTVGEQSYTTGSGFQLNGNTVAISNPYDPFYIYNNYHSVGSTDASSITITFSGEVMPSAGVPNTNTPRAMFYPNPASSEVRFTNFAEKPFTVYMTDIFGRVVLSKTIDDTQQPLNVSDLPNGIYTITIRENKWKLVIKK
jgi:hypothetical protein